jgi:hypothetical protein
MKTRFFAAMLSMGLALAVVGCEHSGGAKPITLANTTWSGEGAKVVFAADTVSVKFGDTTAWVGTYEVEFYNNVNYISIVPSKLGLNDADPISGTVIGTELTIRNPNVPDGTVTLKRQ